MFARSSRLTLLLAALSAVTAAAFSTPPTVVDTANNVSYVGLRTVNSTVEKFLNIRYGTAARFANPEPAVAAPGSVVNASAQGPVCPQDGSGGSVYNTNSTWFSEDCLTLKVARPAGVKEGDKLPVMVCECFYLSGVKGLILGMYANLCVLPRYLWRWSMEW